jgi:uncharacterized protein involved in exopolysaccharide biosynthesis
MDDNTTVPVPPPSGDKFFLIVQLLWRSKKVIVLYTFGFTILMIGLSFLFPNYYRSTATILPADDQSSMSSNFSSIASLAGISLNQTPLSDLIPSYVNSEAILKDVIYTDFYSSKNKKLQNLIEYWEIDEDSALADYEVALKKLRDDLDVSTDKKTGINSISILMKEPQLAADVINKIVNDVDAYLREKHISTASEQRKWIESRIIDVQKTLKNSEDTLKIFQEKNRSIAGSPGLLLQQARLMRNVEINSTLYIELKKQYEFARIDEVKNIPLISVIDAARAQAKKEKPVRSLIAILSVMIGAVGTSMSIVVTNLYGSKLRLFVNAFK